MFKLPHTAQPGELQPDFHGTSNDTNAFYDAVAERYHLFFRDWRAVMQRETAWLRRAFRDRNVKTVLDASCGTGTQSVALALNRCAVSAVDPSEGMLRKARENAHSFGVLDRITFQRADFLTLPQAVRGPFDAVISKGEALTHLLTDADLLAALRNFYALLRPGGTVVVGIRDFELLLEDRPRFVPRQAHLDDPACDVIVFDVYDWNDGPPVTVICNTFVVSGKGDNYAAVRLPVTHRALTQQELTDLMTGAGFVNLRAEAQAWEVVMIGQRPE